MIPIPTSISIFIADNTHKASHPKEVMSFFFLHIICFLHCTNAVSLKSAGIFET